MSAYRITYDTLESSVIEQAKGETLVTGDY